MCGKPEGVTKMENNTGEPRRRAPALQQAHLVLQQEDLQVLVAVGVLPASDQVDEECHQMREHEPEQRAPSTLLLAQRLAGQSLVEGS